jgi:hypothetical protein
MVHTAFSFQHFFSPGQQKIVLNGYVCSIIEEQSIFVNSVCSSSTMHGFGVVCTLPLTEYVMSQNREPSFVSLQISVIDIHFKVLALSNHQI